MTYKRLSVQRILGGFVLVAALMSASCATIGAKKLVSSHTAYNDAVQLTVSREVLANIVRARYADPMQFIAVSSINAQFSVNVSGSGDVGGIGQAGAVGGLAGSVGYSDSPTITFVPQSDAGFYKSFYGLFEVEETVGFGLAFRFAQTAPGWHELGLRFSFGAIDGATDFAYGKSNDLYKRRINAFAQLLRLGATFQQVPEWDLDTSAIEKAKVTALAKVWAYKSGFNFIEEDNGKMVRLARYRMVVALVLPAPNDPEVIAALKNLGVPPGRNQYILRPPTHANPGVFDAYAIRVTPRSMADAIVLASLFVEVPAPHAAIVPVIEPLARDSITMSSVRIHSSTKAPPFPYSIQHRGYWFYIDDSELESKMFFEALVAAYSSRVGSKEAHDEKPQIVLPLGGG